MLIPSFRKFCVGVVSTLLSAAVAGISLPAQAQTPTPEQMEMFQTLPQDQQQSLIESVTGGSSSNRGQRLERTERQLQFPQTVRPRSNSDRDDDELTSTGMPREARLKADDTVLIILELREFETSPRIAVRPRQQNQQLQPQQLGGLDRSMLVNGAGAAQPAQPARNESEDKRIERETALEARLRDLRDRIHRRNPYKLDKWGILNIPELGPIPLAGLTIEEAEQRVAAENSLEPFTLKMTRLPLRPIGADALKPFGYDLFSGRPTTFAPATDVPVPVDYVVGPGDTIQVQLFGNTKGRYSLVVNRDGSLNFPELGPISVGGLSYSDMVRMLEERVRDQMIGTQISVGAGELRSIRVFVLGEADNPGSYTVSGLSTVTNALFVSGGVKKIGSLRKIEVKRNGVIVSRLDLYDLLLKGDTRADIRLLPGDVIFIPPVGDTVSLGGEVRRPAIYELKNETTAGDLIALGGGLTPNADSRLATLERVNEDRQRVTLGLNLSASGKHTSLRSGDVLRVPEIRPVLENSISLSGHVYRSGDFQFRDGMRLTDILPTIEELRPNADQHYLLIRREMPGSRRINVFSADLQAALRNPASAENFELAPRDQIFVFDLESGRDRVIQPLMRELRMQSSMDQPTPQVRASGRVRVPGDYPLEPGMRVSDLVRAGGSLDEAAYGGVAEITRYEVINGEARQAELIKVDLRSAMSGDPSANVALKPFDSLIVKEVPSWTDQGEVEVLGEVRHPGRYPIRRGETLRSLMERAGGLAPSAFSEGAIFTREELKERERKQVEILATRMQSDLALFSLQTAAETGKDAGQALAVGNSLLTELRAAKPVGRLVIDLDKSSKARPGSELDILLKDGDKLMVPRTAQEVTVIGEVQSATSHLFDPTLGRGDYINMSGGLTSRADDDRVYVVRANGSVVAQGGGRWFNGRGQDIRPGDTIVAPLDTERMRPLPFWQAVTSIVYNLAISAAAVNSF